MSVPTEAENPSALPAAPPTKPSPWDRLRKRPDPLTSIALTIPVFLIYHLGVVFVDRRAGVDLVSAAALSLLHASVSGYVIATFAFALLLASVVWVQQKRGVLPVTAAGPVLLESAAFALLLLVTTGWVTHRLERADEAGVLQGLSILDKLVLAAGAGFHEELVFRALLVTGGSWLIVRLFRMSQGLALTIAVVASSLIFSLAYNFGPLAEIFAFDEFAYRALIGLCFAGLYLLRGFAVVVYAHVIYAALTFFLYG